MKTILIFILWLVSLVFFSLYLYEWRQTEAMTLGFWASMLLSSTLVLRYECKKPVITN
jgi:hypothetical protein